MIVNYSIIPGSVTLYDGTPVTMTYNDVIAAWGVDPTHCVLGPVTGLNALRYIELRPRADGDYNDIQAEFDRGDNVKWGPDFDGKKRWTQETNYETLYSAKDAEEKL